MNRKMNLILGASGHLPSGACEAEFEALYNGEIKPLVQALNKFPRINMVFHYSGVILYWIERRHPELFMLIEDLLSRKQAEFLGGGFYNPVLPLLPPADKIGQMEMLTTYLRKHFGKRPQGCWLPAMAWEQNLVGPLNSCGMSYTFLEDQQFSGAGVKAFAGEIFFPCITEDQGKLLTVFPAAGALGRELKKGMFQTGRAGKILNELLEKLPDGEYPVTVFPFEGDISSTDDTPDSPKTVLQADGHDSSPVYENFFEELSSADSRIEFTSPARIFKNLRGLKKVYFPGAWVDADAGNGSHPRRFLADHPEAGGIYAKMIYVHTLINNQLRGDKTRKHTALEELWKAQDSGVFRLGSGVSPGLLHAPVRNAAYRSLLEAEKITREKGKFTPCLSVFDFDLDGDGEYIFQDDKLNCFVKSRGAGIFELDYLPAAWNYLDTLAPETANPEGGGRRCAFVDWLAPPKTLPENAGPGGIHGGRFCGAEEYEASGTDRVRRRVTFTLPPRAGLPWGEIRIEKTWQLKKNSLALEYVLENTGKNSQRFTFCPQLDLSFPGEGEGFLRVLCQREGGKEGITFSDALTVQDIRALEFQDIKNETVITLELSRGFDARIFHVRHAAVSAAEGYQSTCVMPLLHVSLEAGKTWKAAFALKISS